MALKSEQIFPLEWIDQILAISSETQHSNARVVEFLRPLVQSAGLQWMEHKVQEGGQTFINLIAHNGRPTAPDLLLFNTHLDTVSGGDPAQWTKTGKNPLKATWVKDRVYGLGSADVKIDFLCKLWAAKQAKPQRPFALVGTYGEERGLIGVQKLFEDKKVTPKFAVVGEPSDLELIYAHKGHFIGTASFSVDSSPGEIKKSWKGKAAHSSTPHLGINALRKAFEEIAKKKWGITSLTSGTNSNRVPESAHGEFVKQASSATQDLLKFIFEMEKLEKSWKKNKDPRFSPSVTTLSWNLCRRVGGRLELTFDIRTLPSVDSQQLRTQVESLLPSSARWVDITIDLPLAGDPDNTLMKAAAAALKACGVRPVKKTKASSTEAAVYHANGAQAIVFGPGISVGNVHKPNEYNLLSQIRTATRFYQELLQRPWETK